MMSLIDESGRGGAPVRRRPFRPHRDRRGAPLGLPQVRAIFDYFDCLLVGLTATPKDEVDHNTYALFDLEDGVPTDAYALDEAVADGFLVPPQAVSVPLKFLRAGIRYDDLSRRGEGPVGHAGMGRGRHRPDAVDAPELNKWLFNDDTVDKVLRHLMTDGLKVAGGDRLGKTIIFAKNQEHAEFIERAVQRQLPASRRPLRPRHHPRDGATRRP